MDKIKHYQEIIKQGLTEYASFLSTPPPDYKVVFAFDDEHNQYLLRKLGWTKKNRIRQTVLHVAIDNDKICIEEDWTEEGIATYFLEQGLTDDEIVLGFQPPQIRHLSEFATA